MSAWFVYIIRCADDSLYTGITTDVSRRFAEHATAGPRAAKYLRGRGPLTLVFSAPAGSKSEALSLERHIKSLPRKNKLALLDKHLVLTEVGSLLWTSERQN